MFLETGDPAFNTTTPGDNSGWQYEGKFGFFLGVPIAPHFFITAAHLPGVGVGTPFDLHGDLYTTIAFHNIPGTDLRLWEVNHAKPFPTYAPVSSGINDIGANAAVFGRGTQRGSEVFLAAVSKGWRHGPGDGVKRWGRNIVTGTVSFPNFGELLYCDFDQPGIPNECHLSVGDSGGGLFVLENGLWRLAGIHALIDGNFREPPNGGEFGAALFDCGGFDVGSSNTWEFIPDEEADITSSFYSSRISSSLAAIANLAPEVNSLASEDYSAWLRLYFSPSQIADANLCGPLADFDKDGINNLLEFALNLDPIFNERATMEAGTGLRGLPLVRIENISGQDRLTIEFVSRSAGSGAGLTYIAEFSDDLSDWQSGGTPAVTAINPRWDRVKVADTSNTTLSPKRFARLRVVDP
jgi:hypothetical protein